MRNNIAFVALGFVFGFVTMPIFFERFYIPEDQTFFYAYQNFIAGLCAIIGGGVAYLGILKNLHWQESQKKIENEKIVEDLGVDSKGPLIQLLLFNKLIDSNRHKDALKLLQNTVPLKLGFKFFDENSIEKLPSLKRLNVRGMRASIENFNLAFQNQQYGEAYKAYTSFIHDYKNFFSDKDFEMWSSIIDAIAHNRAVSKEEKND